MTWLTLLLTFKIGFTAVFVALPMLLLPASAFEARLGVDVRAAPYIRLYGWALIALLVGYAGGIAQAQAGQFPWGVVTMGLVSNLGATALMLSPWGKGPSPIMPIVFGSIAAGLLVSACFPAKALLHVF